MRSASQTLGLLGGVNLNRDPQVLRPDQLAFSKNAYPVIPGILGKRSGMSARQIALALGGSRRVFVLSWAIAPAIVGYKYVAHIHVGASSAANCKQYLIATDFEKLDPTNISSYVIYDLGATQGSYEPAKFVNYRGIVIAIVPGVEGFFTLAPEHGPYQWVKSSFIWPPAYGPQVQAEPIKPRNAASYKQRMVYGNLGLGKGNWLVWADIAAVGATWITGTYENPFFSIVGSDVLAYNGRHVEVDSIAGEDITAMQEISLGAVGSAIDSVLLLLTERSCVFISGEILETDDSGGTDAKDLFGSYTENRINYDAGCVSQDTLVKTPYGWIWTGPDDVWLLNGNYPQRIGTNIRPALLNCPAGTRKHWSAAYANGMYVLSLVTTSSTVSDYNQDVTTHIHEYWYLDLRDGPPRNAEEARWWGPMVNQLDYDQNVVFGKLLSVKDDDGKELVLVPGTIIDTAPSGSLSTVLYDLFGGSEKDDLVVPTITANEWQPDTAYRVGDIVRPRYGQSAIAAKRGYLHYCSTAYQQLAFEFQTTNFTVGQVVTGASTLAKGTIAAITDNGSTGILFLSDVTMGFAGTGFSIGEVLSDPLGGDGNVASPGLIDGLSGSSDPTWATTSGGATTDNAIRWNEIRGINELIGTRLETGRSVGHFTTDIRAIDRLLNDNTHEKLIRRVDANIAATNKMAISATALLDQSNAPISLGTNIFGGESLQGSVDVLPAVIGGIKSRAKSFRPDEDELVQCRTAQIKIADETTYVIDETNNYLVVCLLPTNRNMTALVQFEIPQGEYADLDALLAAIVAAWNSSAAKGYYDTLSSLLGGSGNAAWATDSAYDDVWPYFSQITPAFSGAGGFNTTLVMGNSDAPALFFVGSGTTEAGTAYLSRSKRLCALLGFDTTQALVNGLPVGNLDDNIPSEPTDLTYVFSFGERFDGAQVVHKYNSKRFNMSNAIVIVQPKGVAPFKNKNRS